MTTIKQARKDRDRTDHHFAEKVQCVNDIIENLPKPIERKRLIARMCQHGYWKSNPIDSTLFIMFLIREGLLEK